MLELIWNIGNLSSNFVAEKFSSYKMFCSKETRLSEASHLSLECLIDASWNYKKSHFEKSLRKSWEYQVLAEIKYDS